VPAERPGIDQRAHAGDVRPAAVAGCGGGSARPGAPSVHAADAEGGTRRHPGGMGGASSGRPSEPPAGEPGAHPIGIR
jgi:hypothetical protein